MNGKVSSEDSEEGVEASVSESEKVGEGGERGGGVGILAGCGSGMAEGDGTVMVCTAVGDEAGYGGLIIAGDTADNIEQTKRDEMYRGRQEQRLNDESWRAVEGDRWASGEGGQRRESTTGEGEETNDVEREDCGKESGEERSGAEREEGMQRKEEESSLSIAKKSHGGVESADGTEGDRVLDHSPLIRR